MAGHNDKGQLVIPREIPPKVFEKPQEERLSAKLVDPRAPHGGAEAE